MANVISKSDVHQVANRLQIEATEEQVEGIVEGYVEASLDDPISNWSEVVECMLYDLAEPKRLTFH